jgi:hypothetical protein
MFGHMKAQPILKVMPTCSVEEAVRSLIEATEGAQAVRWLEFPTAVLLLLSITGDSQSGAFYVLDRKTGSWLWVDFEDDQYGGYSATDFDLLVHEYDFLSLAERPALLRADAGWLLEPRKPAEMAACPSN